MLLWTLESEALQQLVKDDRINVKSDLKWKF